MSRKLLVYLFLCFCVFKTTAQTKNTIIIDGQVIDKIKQCSLPQSTIRILNLPDSSFINGTVTDEKGDFSIRVNKSGHILVVISYLGYEKVEKNIDLSKSNDVFSLGKIEMKETTEHLKEIVIKAQAPAIKAKGDTLEYNVDSYKMQDNAVVEDLLKKLPGFEISNEGTITAHGKTVKRVFVDGKEFFGNDPTVATKNLNSDIIDKIQLIDKKSDIAKLTGVDDGDDETVINLTIKEGMKNGWFGNLSGGYGYAKDHPNRYELRTMVNRFSNTNQYAILGGINNINTNTFTDRGGNIFSGSQMRRGRSSGDANSGIATAGSIGGNFNVGKDNDFRVGGNVLLSKKDQNEKTESFKQNIIQDSSTYSNSITSGVNNSKNASTDLKLEWQMNEKTRIEIQPSIGYNKTNTEEQSVFLNTNEEIDKANWISYQGPFINKGSNRRDMEMEGSNYDIRSTIVRESGRKEGRKYSLGITLTGKINNGISFVDNMVEYASINIANNDSIISTKQKQEEDTDEVGGRLNLTWLEPVGNKRFFQFSYNGQLSKTRSERNTYLWNENTNDYYTSRTDSLSDYIKNSSFVHSAGISLRTIREKYNYNIGLTTEPSTRESKNELDSTRSYTRHVINFSPILELNYLWNKRKSLKINYRGRTQQPSINQLQSAKNNSNPLNIQIGNQNLKPSYTNNLSLRYSNFNEEKLSSCMLMISSNYTLNSITNKTTYDRETGVLTTMPVNVNGVWSMNGRGIYSIPIGTQFKFNSSSAISYNHNVGFSSSGNMKEAVKNRSHNYKGDESFSFGYYSNLFDINLKGDYKVQYVKNSISSNNNTLTQNYGGTVSGTLYFPWSISCMSEYTYNGLSGYASAFGKSEKLWNINITKSFLQKRGSVYIRLNDILHNKKSISQQISANSIQYSNSDQISNYVMVGLSIRFGSMGNKPGDRRTRGEGQMDFRPEGDRPPRPDDMRPPRDGGMGPERGL